MLITSLIASLIVYQSAFAQDHSTKSANARETKDVIFKSSTDIAINGYDPVAYFTDHKPEKGKQDFNYKYDGAVWQFSNANHLTIFKKNPEKYMPQYGGFCAYGISHKVGLVKTVPNIWEIVNGKLYLFSPAKKLDKIWQDHPKENIKAGDKEWPKLIAKKKSKN